MRRSLILSALLPALLLPAAASASTRLETGLADDDLLLKSPGAAPGYVADWAAAGVDDVRVHVGWREGAPHPAGPRPPRDFHPSDPAAYDFARVQRAVALLREHGVDVTLAL